MPIKGYVVESFIFKTKEEYEQAKKEVEAILYIEAKMNIDDLKGVLKVYNKLIIKEIFHTIIGYQFLFKLRTMIIDSKQYNLDEIYSIPILDLPYELEKEKVISKDKIPWENDHMLLETYKIKSKNSKIIIIFLAAIIAILLYLSYHDQGGAFADYEKQVLNKYAEWQEELDTKEKNLIERELVIQQQEKN